MKKKQNTLIYIIPIVLILFGIVGFFLMKGGIVQQTALKGELTVQGVSPTTIISNDEDLANANFRISTVANVGSESLVGSLNPSDVSTNTNNQFSSTYPLEFGVSALNQQAVYTARSSATPIKQVTTYKTQSNRYGEDAPLCNSGDHEIRRIRDNTFPLFSYTTRRWCYNEKAVGGLGFIEVLPSTESKISLYMKVGSETITQEINTKTQSSAEFRSQNGQFRGTAQFTGSLTTGTPPPDVSGYKAIFMNEKNKWQIINSYTPSTYTSSLSTYKGFLDTTRPEGICYAFSCDDNVFNSQLQNARSSFDTAYNQITTEDLSIQGISGASFTQPTEGKPLSESAQFTIPLTGIRVENPQIIWTVQASWIGIKINVGKPKIMSASCDKTKSGDIGLARVSVMNIGTADGSFTASLTGCEPEVIQYDSAESIKQQVPSGQSANFNIRWKSNTNVDASKTCQIKVYDTAKTSNYDTTSVTCQVEKGAVCVEGDLSQMGNCIYQCTNGQPAKKECCENGVVFDSGTYQCKKITGCTYDTDCQTGYKCLKDLLHPNGECIYSPVSCRLNSDCDAGFICDKTTNQCVPAGCNADIDCPTEQYCNKDKKPAVCEPKKTCDSLKGWFGLPTPAWLGCVLKQALEPLKWIVAVGGALAVFLLVWLNLSKLFKGKKGKGDAVIPLIFALIFAGLVFALIWFYFFAGLILAFLFIIITSIIRIFIPLR